MRNGQRRYPQMEKTGSLPSAHWERVCCSGWRSGSDHQYARVSSHGWERLTNYIVTIQPMGFHCMRIHYFTLHSGFAVRRERKSTACFEGRGQAERAALPVHTKVVVAVAWVSQMWNGPERGRNGYVKTLDWGAGSSFLLPALTLASLDKFSVPLCPVCRAVPASPEDLSLQRQICALLSCMIKYPAILKLFFIPLPNFYLLLMEWFWFRFFISNAGSRAVAVRYASALV